VSNGLQFKTVLQWRIAMAAIDDTWRQRHAFSAMSLCKKHDLKDTRHMRAVLTEMVGHGWLYTYLQVGRDGRRRRMYCAQLAAMIDMFEVA